MMQSDKLEYDLVDDDAVLEALPEYSAVGEPASNGKAERAVQMFEDQVRT